MLLWSQNLWWCEVENGKNKTTLEIVSIKKIPKHQSTEMKSLKGLFNSNKKYLKQETSHTS